MRKKSKEMIRKPTLVSESQARGFKEWRGPTLHSNRTFTPPSDRSKDDEQRTEVERAAENLRILIAQKKATLRRTAWRNAKGKGANSDISINEAKRRLHNMGGRRK